MNNLYRSLISLATVFPLSITFSYLYSDWLLSLLPDVVSHFLEARWYSFCAQWCSTMLLGK